MTASPGNKVVRAVLVAGAITLVVTLVRLIGELCNWDPLFFSKEPGGREGNMPALVGISWLVLPFGLWFGRLVAQAHGRPRMLRAWLLTLLPIALWIGAVSTVSAMYPGDFKVLGPVIGLGGLLAALVTLFAWPRAFVANLMYALLARVPVIVLTYVAVACDWKTHFSNLNAKLGEVSALERANMLVMAQATFWISYTILVGGVFALLGALTVRAAAAADSAAFEQPLQQT
jgi:hypothetical protein